MYCILCTVLYVLYCLYCTVCTVLSVLYCMYCVLYVLALQSSTCHGELLSLAIVVVYGEGVNLVFDILLFLFLLTNVLIVSRFE